MIQATDDAALSLQWKTLGHFAMAPVGRPNHGTYDILEPSSSLCLPSKLKGSHIHKLKGNHIHNNMHLRKALGIKGT